jgi:hypothetical protein
MTQETKFISVVESTQFKALENFVLTCHENFKEGWSFDTSNPQRVPRQVGKVRYSVTLVRGEEEVAEPVIPLEGADEAVEDSQEAQPEESKKEEEVSLYDPSLPELSDEQKEKLKGLSKKKDLDQFCKQVGIEPLKGVSPTTKYRATLKEMFGVE